MSHSKIYYVEDDPDDAELLTQVFAKKGYDIQVFPDPIELFLQLRDDVLLPTLIILDINLPKMNGTEAVRLLQREPKFSRIPVAVLSTNPRELTLLDEKQLFFMKPTQYVDYDLIVDSLLNHYS